MSAPPRRDKEQIRRAVMPIIYGWVEALGPDSPIANLKLSDLNELASKIAEYAEPLQDNR